MHRLGIALALQKVVEELHGTRAVHGDARHDILERGGLHLHHELLYAAAFELEDRLAVPARDDLVDLGILVAELVEVDVDAGVFLDIFHRLVYVGQRLEPEEVHLEQSLLFHHVLVELGGDVVAVPGQRDMLDDGIAADDHARRVHGGLPGHTFERDRGVDDRARLRVGGVELCEFVRVLLAARRQTLFEFDLAAWDGFDPVVDLAVRDIKNPADILDRLLGAHGRIGDDLRHIGRAVLVHDIVDDLGTAHITKVYVEVGVGHPLL